MYKKASSELVVARRRRGADNGRQHVRVAAADRVQGPLGEDHMRVALSVFLLVRVLNTFCLHHQARGSKDSSQAQEAYAE